MIKVVVSEGDSFVGRGKKRILNIPPKTAFVITCLYKTHPLENFWYGGSFGTIERETGGNTYHWGVMIFTTTSWKIKGDDLIIMKRYPAVEKIGK